jgi:hypothetical protein
MTTKQKYGLSTIVAVLILAGLFVLHTLDKNQAVGIARADEQDKAAQTAEERADKATSDRDAITKQYEEAIALQEAAVTTPQAAVKVINHYIPSGATSAIVQRQDLSAAAQAQLPDAPSYAVETDQKAEDTAKALLACDATGKALETCKADLADANLVVDALRTDAKAWQAAAKGGTRWQRFKAGAGHMLCGGLATGAGTFAGQRGNAQTGMIVGGGALIGCELLKVR